MKKITTYSVLSIMGILSLSMPAPVEASGYRMLKPASGWENQELGETTPSCSVLRKYETGNIAHLSLQDGVISTIFEIPHLNVVSGQEYVLKLQSDNVKLHRSRASNLEGHRISVPLGALPEYKQRIEDAESFKLSVGLNGVMFASIDAKSGLKLLEKCMDTKKKIMPLPISETDAAPEIFAVSQDVRFGVVPKNPAMAFENQMKRSLETPPTDVPKPAEQHQLSQNVLVEEPSLALNTPAELLSAAAELSREAPNIVKAIPAETLPKLDAPIEPALEVTSEAFNVFQAIEEGAQIQDTSPPELTDVIEADTRQPSLGELRAALPKNVLPRTNSLFSKPKRSPLEEEERALFESMKTKMLLLEKEKEAVRKKLSNMRQREIDVMKIDINSLRKIDEMAAKIEILERKVEQTEANKSAPFTGSTNRTGKVMNDLSGLARGTPVD